jgi:hypothetical protein
MRRFLFPLLTALALTSCSAPSSEQLAVTAQQIVATGVALTLQALPTNTAPPSPTPTLTLLPTETPRPALPTSSSTITVPAAQGTLANALPTELSATEKADKSDNSTLVLLQNNSGKEVWLIIDSPVYLEYRFSDSFTILLPVGVYHYRVWIGEKGPLAGTFRIGNHDKHTMIFSAEKVQFQGP